MAFTVNVRAAMVFVVTIPLLSIVVFSVMAASLPLYKKVQSSLDTVLSIAASLGSLKGPKHGGANIKVVQMFEDMKRTVKDWTDEDEV